MRKQVCNDEERAIFLENARSWRKERINWDEVEEKRKNRNEDRDDEGSKEGRKRRQARERKEERGETKRDVIN